MSDDDNIMIYDSLVLVCFNASNKQEASGAKHESCTILLQVLIKNSHPNARCMTYVRLMCITLL